MNKLKVVSWNIWQGAHLSEVKSFLKDVDADIIALQEVSGDERNIIKELADSLGCTYITAFDMSLPMKYVPEHLRTSADHLTYGSVILSKHEIVGGGSVVISDEDNRTIAKADIKIGDEILTVYGLHLKHTHQQDSEHQNVQADNLLKMVPEKRAIVMGDFNSLKGSYPITKISGVLSDTEIGEPTPTWSVYKDGCSYCQIGDLEHKLDYIFTTKDIKTESFIVGDSRASDHLPVIAVVEF